MKTRELVICKRIRRASRKKFKHGPSVNKYAHLVPKRDLAYDPKDKTYRDLPIIGAAGEIVPAGTRMYFHGRIYSLMENTPIPQNAPLALSDARKREGVGRFKLVAQVN